VKQGAKPKKVGSKGGGKKGENHKPKKEKGGPRATKMN